MWTKPWAVKVCFNETVRTLVVGLHLPPSGIAMSLHKAQIYKTLYIYVWYYMRPFLFHTHAWALFLSWCEMIFSQEIDVSVKIVGTCSNILLWKYCCWWRPINGMLNGEMDEEEGASFRRSGIVTSRLGKDYSLTSLSRSKQFIH